MADKYWNRKVLLFKLETTYGTDPAPVGGTDAILAQQVRLQPMEGQDVARELDRPFYGADPTLPADLHQKLTFRVELAPSGTAGTAPAWGPLIRACGCAQTIVATTSVTYNPITNGAESGTFHFSYDGIRHRLRGARGTFKIVVEASGIPYIEFTFWGLFEVATDTANPTPTLSAWKDPVVANSVNTPGLTINSVAQVMRSFTFAAGVKVQPRFLIPAAEMIITGRSEMIDTQIEARAMATLNPYSLASAATRIPLVMSHGNVDGARVAINAPLSIVQRPASIEGQQNVAEWPLRLIPQPNTGNDQWTIVLT